MTAPARDGEALGRPELPLVTANAIFVAPVHCGPVDDRRRGAARRSHRVAGRRRPLRPRHRRRRARDRTACSAPARHRPRVPRRAVPPTSRCPVEFEIPPPAAGRRPVARHQLPRADRVVAGAPVRALGPTTKRGPGPHRGVDPLARATAQPDGSYDLLALAVHGDLIGPGDRSGARPEGPRLHVPQLEIGIRFIRPPDRPWVLQEIEAGTSATATRPARRALGRSAATCSRSRTQTAHLRRPNFDKKVYARPLRGTLHEQRGSRSGGRLS